MNLASETLFGIFIFAFSLSACVTIDMDRNDSVKTIDANSKISPVDCQEMINLDVITSINPVPYDRLRMVSFSYNTDTGIKEDGQIVVLDVAAPDIAELMSKLLFQGFVIHKAKPITFYNGDDDASMADNNSSAFNGRATTGGTKWSLHAYGAAIDINPLENPYVSVNEDGSAQVKPPQAARYSLNRSQYRPNKSARLGMAEEIVGTFAHHGFLIWGGDWNWPLDYQHFQIGPRSYVEALTSSTFSEGEALFAAHRDTYRNCKKTSKIDNELARRKLCVEQALKSLP